jgi:hypothetical protein
MDKSINGILPDLTVDKRVIILLFRHQIHFQSSNLHKFINK